MDLRTRRLYNLLAYFPPGKERHVAWKAKQQLMAPVMGGPGPFRFQQGLNLLELIIDGNNLLVNRIKVTSRHLKVALESSVGAFHS
jgi:hypothetical protein